MWKSIFLHEFRGGDIRNFQALDGSITSNSFIGMSGNNSEPFLGLTPSQGFSYTLKELLVDVIGVSVSVRIRHPLQTVTGNVPIASLGQSIDLKLAPFDDPAFNPTELSGPAKVLMGIGGIDAELGVVILPHRRFTNLRVDWHTSGQCRLVQDGKLAGYRHSISAGLRTAVSDVKFGLLDLPLASNPRYELNYVFVRALRREDSLSRLGRLFPKLAATEYAMGGRCQLLAAMSLLNAADKMRSFMSAFHAEFTTDWTLHDNPPSVPFSNEAATAHKEAKRAMQALADMLRKNDLSDTVLFLAPLETFLRILHDSKPAEFSSLAQELSPALALPPECAAAFRDSVNAQDLAPAQPIIDLLTEVAGLIDQVAGGH